MASQKNRHLLTFSVHKISRQLIGLMEREVEMDAGEHV